MYRLVGHEVSGSYESRNSGHLLGDSDVQCLFPDPLTKSIERVLETVSSLNFTEPLPSMDRVLTVRLNRITKWRFVCLTYVS